MQITMANNVQHAITDRSVNYVLLRLNDELVKFRRKENEICDALSTRIKKEYTLYLALEAGKGT